MKKFYSKHVWVVNVICTDHCGKIVSSKISSEAYSFFGDAVKFCESRNNGAVIKLDPLTYVFNDESCFYSYKYCITSVTVVPFEMKEF